MTKQEKTLTIYEATLKLIAYGVRGYFFKTWN